MTELTRRSLLAALGVATTGCLSAPRDGTAPDSPSTGASPTITSPTDGPSSPTGITPGVNQPRADHAVYLDNQTSQERTVRVQVVRQATDETVYDETRTIAPETEQEVYNLQQANPDGIEAFAICGQVVDPTSSPGGAEPSETPDSPRRDCITMQTDACHGTAHVTVPAEGELQVIYSIC